MAKKAATKKSKKKSAKRSTTKKAASKSGVSAKPLTKDAIVFIDGEYKSRGKYIRGRFTEVKPGKFKIETFEEVVPDKVKKNKFEGTYGLTKGQQAKGSKKKASTPRGASSTAPVVYQTLREKVAAVEKNIGKTQSLKDFLDSAGWR